MIARTLIAMTAVAVISACGTSLNVTVGHQSPFKGMQTAALVPQDGNCAEIDAIVRKQLMAHSIAPQSPLPRGTRQSGDVDLLVTYSEERAVEKPAELKSITVNLIEAPTGNLLATGRWEDSPLQKAPDRSEVVKELMDDMMARLEM